ncbi:MAG: hypothetical protein ACXWEZ_12255 [Actinomycetota bacterium]
MKKRHTITVIALTVASLLAITPAAFAGGGGGGGTVVNAGGSCSGQSEWKMKLKPDNSSLEMEFEVDSNVSGQSWNVRIKQNGSRIFNGTRVTHGASGSFTIHRRPNDSAGTDRFVARATNPSTGETCIGKAHV